MGIVDSLRQLPSAAWQAIKDYFAGLRLFFNRENWSHSITFIITLSLFLILAVVQRPLRFILWDPISGVHPGVVNSVRVMALGGCGAFIGFLFLGFLGVFRKGQQLLFQSRFRHAISPLMIVSSALFFIFLLPPLLIRFPNAMNVMFGANGLFFTIFTWSWIIMIFLQVILLGYTIVKSTKWLTEYTGIPAKQPPKWKYGLILSPMLILIPILILAWFPVVFAIMVNGFRPGDNPPPIPLPNFVLWLLSLVPGDFLVYLLLISPIVIIIAVLALWRRYPSVAMAIASFGFLYPALVYYYRFRVIQYFINWSFLPETTSIAPLPNAGFFQILLLLLTFVLVLLGAAKIQRNVSPNPFGLFAIMVGTIVFLLFWVIIPDYAIGFGVEYIGMIGSALSALLALIVFAILPISYASYRIHKGPDKPSVAEESATVELEVEYLPSKAE
ncbi:MAG: hypothetical protein ACFE9D_05990 [Promethearchaeota archaeon]